MDMPDILVPAERRWADTVTRRETRIGRANRAIFFDLVRLPAVWWRRTLDREHLAGLSDYLLKDIGLTRADVEREARQPFWWPITGPSDGSRRRW
jgi:uncharacterized protein YjiS (DUF1127 family)